MNVLKKLSQQVSLVWDYVGDTFIVLPQVQISRSKSPDVFLSYNDFVQHTQTKETKKMGKVAFEQAEKYTKLLNDNWSFSYLTAEALTIGRAYYNDSIFIGFIPMNEILFKAETKDVMYYFLCESLSLPDVRMKHVHLFSGNN